MSLNIFYKLKKITAYLMFLSSTLSAQMNLFWSHPVPTGNQLNAVKFINQQTGFAVGAAGTIIKTTNGGMNWVTQNSPFFAFLWDVTFVDANTWVIVGVDVSVGNNGIILRTTNGGDNWNIVQNQPGANYKGVDFPSPNAGYVVGAGTIHKSTDQGASWVLQPSGTGNFYCVDFYNDLIGAAAGINRVMLTTNGGINWIAQTVIENILDLVTGIVQLDANNIAGGVETPNNDYIMKTTNGGLNWINYHNFLNLNGEIMRDMYMVNNTGFIVTNNGRIVKTTNGGLSWVSDSTFLPPYPQAFVFMGLNMFDENLIYITGGGGTVIKSTNSGINWNMQIGFQRDLRGIQFLSSNVGYAAGEGGAVLKTTNAGSNWMLMPTGSIRHFRSLSFIDSNTGYVVGDTGIIVKTTNGGTNWITQTSGTIVNLLSVLFINANTGSAVGGETNNGNGIILRTTNGGNNWTAQLSGTSLRFTSLYFLNSDTGFVSATNGIHKTTNGGINWTAISGAEGHDIYFTSASTGYAMCSNTNVYKTTDGGNTWFIVSSGYNTAYYSFQFFGNFGIAAGDNGRILRTTNGGVNWTAVTSITENPLRSLHFINENTGYIAGDFGAIIKTTNGGLSFLQANNEIIPKKFSLYQNYPNPFNPSTKIKFDIPPNIQGGLPNVKITIFDVQGREIIKLLDEELSAGVYEISFDGSSLSSGVFFYRIETKGYSETRKMILLK